MLIGGSGGEDKGTWNKCTSHWNKGSAEKAQITVEPRNLGENSYQTIKGELQIESSNFYFNGLNIVPLSYTESGSCFVVKKGTNVVFIRNWSVTPKDYLGPCKSEDFAASRGMRARRCRRVAASAQRPSTGPLRSSKRCRKHHGPDSISRWQTGG